MWTLANSDLKYRLTLRISAVSAICFAVISAVVVWDIDRSTRIELNDIADITARTLQLQLNKTRWVNNPGATFPDLDSITSLVMRPGLCIAYRAGSGQMVQQFCGGAQTQSEPPRAFAVVHRAMFDHGREAARPVLFGDRPLGEAVAWIDPAVLSADAWRELSRLLPVLAGALVLLCVLSYAALARALRPTRLIRAGLERIAANDLTARLPPFDLAELSAIRDAFNQLAENLATSIAERNELTRRLIALQDDERRHLARELHDEFGQSLAAIRALASAAGQSAAQTSPELLSECDSIARTAGDMMSTLRGALFRLRPPDIDELGLGASLEGLVTGWSRRQSGRTRFEIRLAGAVDSLPETIGLNLYRIAQEALTNAARHADAAQVLLQLTVHDRRDAPAAIELTVEDDGRAGDQAVRPGMGLLGMRERVAGLGGQLNFESRQDGGSRLHVGIPFATSSNRSLSDQRVLEECAA
ncbi:putative two-component sensor histidine kinase [Bradyrhizobium sp. STM 3843]|uniref:sensor histidine kinase n=1 Tax=Bradyrhizobium sp. STM 3843 TaxID=551947 RepID=UPI0002404F72|nr:histidine kinase [Bradyrhizobium sp. STM 3843]CCE08099.1 putative two-component sensor histidine kinase [Bradyrhizobium sp. STM 3843]